MLRVIGRSSSSSPLVWSRLCLSKRGLYTNTAVSATRRNGFLGGVAHGSRQFVALQHRDFATSAPTTTTDDVSSKDSAAPAADASARPALTLMMPNDDVSLNVVLGVRNSTLQSLEANFAVRIELEQTSTSALSRTVSIYGDSEQAEMAKERINNLVMGLEFDPLTPQLREYEAKIDDMFEANLKAAKEAKEQRDLELLGLLPGQDLSLLPVSKERYPHVRDIGAMLDEKSAKEIVKEKLLDVEECDIQRRKYTLMGRQFRRQLLRMKRNKIKRNLRKEYKYLKWKHIKLIEVDFWLKWKPGEVAFQRKCHATK